MQCHKCEEPSAHSIHVRDGIPPIDPTNPKAPDRSTIHVVGFCPKHWEELQRFLKE